MSQRTREGVSSAKKTLGTHVLQLQTAVLDSFSTDCPLSAWTCMDPKRLPHCSWGGWQYKGDGGLKLVVFLFSFFLELGVLSGFYAGLASLFQAAAVKRRLLWDVSQGVWSDQVAERDGKGEEERWGAAMWEFNIAAVSWKRLVSVLWCFIRL